MNHALDLLRRAVRPIVRRLSTRIPIERQEQPHVALVEQLEDRRLLTSIVIDGGAADEAWLLRMKPDLSGTVQLFDNATAAGTPIEELSIRRLESITINGNAGDDRLIVDLTYGVPFRDAQLVFNGGAHIAGDAFEIKGNTSTKGSYNPGPVAGADTFNAARKTIYLNDVEPVTVSHFAVLKLITPNPDDTVNMSSPISGQGRITGSSSGADLGELIFSDTGTLVVDAAANDGTAGDDSVAVGSTGAAAMGLSALYVHAGTGVNSLSLAGGSTTLRSTVAPSGTGFLNVTVGDSAVLNVPTTQYLGTLTINDNARVNLTSSVYKCLLLEDLSISSSGTLDLADNDLIVHNGDAQEITNWIASGRAGGAWNGYGITSSTAGTTAGGGYTALGVIVNQNQYNQTLYSTWSNQPVTGSDVLVKFSYSGDANLDGTVNSDDYYRIDSGWLNHLTGWYNGDFDYSGAVASGDYYLIDSNYLYQGNIGRKPPFTIGWGAAAQEGDAYEISLFAPLSDGGTDYDPIGSWTIFWGDDEISTVPGNPGQTVYAQHVYADDSGAGTYQISVAANGTDLSYWAGNHALSVTNVSPTLAATGASQIDEGQEYSLDLSWSDPGDDVGHWFIDWGDGTPVESVDWDIDGAYHSFAAGTATATISATASDDDGTYGPILIPVSIRPAPPSDLSFDSLASTEVTLFWTDNSSSESEFAVEQSADGVLWETAETTEADRTFSWMGHLLPGTTYYYRVRSHSAGGWSAYSDVIAVTTLTTAPDDPSGVMAIIDDLGQTITLSWADGSDDETGFVIERSIDGGEFATLATVGPDVTEYVTPTAPSGVVYAYQVYAFNATGDSRKVPATAPTTRNSISYVNIAFYGAGPKDADRGWGNYWLRYIAEGLDPHVWLYKQHQRLDAIRRLLRFLDTERDFTITEAEARAVSINVLGYSWGGMAAASLTEELSEPGEQIGAIVDMQGEPGNGYTLLAPVPIAKLVTIDPVPILRTARVRSNVQLFRNYYQEQGRRRSFMPTYHYPDGAWAGEWELSSIFSGNVLDREGGSPSEQEQIELWGGAITNWCYPFRSNSFDSTYGILPTAEVNHMAAPWMTAGIVTYVLGGDMGPEP